MAALAVVPFTRAQCQAWLANPVVNPTTNRRIQLDGPVFNGYVASCVAHGIDIQSEIDSNLKPRMRRKFGVDPIPAGSAELKCNNETDPVSLDGFSGMPLSEQHDVVRLGSGSCHRLDSIHEWYRTKTEAGENVTDPINPGYSLTDGDKATINRLMAENVPGYHAPGAAVPGVPLHPAGYSLRFVDHRRDHRYAVAIIYHDATDTPVNFISNFPQALDSGITGSVDFTSAILMVQLMAIWNAGQLTLGNNPSEETGIDLLDVTANGIGYWSGAGFVAKFIALMLEVKDKYDALPAAYRQ